jgi:hypothetical protein
MKTLTATATVVGLLFLLHLACFTAYKYFVLRF